MAGWRFTIYRRTAACRCCKRPLFLTTELTAGDLLRLQRHSRECRPQDRIELHDLSEAERYFRLVRSGEPTESDAEGP